MRLRLKPLAEQVIVITGASSGIGLATARAAARRGARVVLAARSADALRQLGGEIHREGGEALGVVTDVGVASDVERLADAAVRHFGGFDTWINNAAASVYSTCVAVNAVDLQRVMDTNLWGVIHGSRVACAHLRHRGGALINVGSVLSDCAVPLQGIYTASKHALSSWTNALRRELAADGVPVSVSLIKPGPIDTPYAAHAKSYFADEQTHVPPVYLPRAAARAILHCATHPVREVHVGSTARLLPVLARAIPRLADTVIARVMTRWSHSGRPPPRPDALHRPSEDLRERGDYAGFARDSLYTAAVIHPLRASVALGLVGGAAVGTALMWRRRAR